MVLKSDSITHPISACCGWGGDLYFIGKVLYAIAYYPPTLMLSIGCRVISDGNYF
jgi:hypothetical protein